LGCLCGRTIRVVQDSLRSGLSLRMISTGLQNFAGALTDVVGRSARRQEGFGLDQVCKQVLKGWLSLENIPYRHRSVRQFRLGCTDFGWLRRCATAYSASSRQSNQVRTWSFETCPISLGVPALRCLRRGGSSKICVVRSRWFGLNSYMKFPKARPVSFEMY
jgi:hypothetical protein